MKDLSLLLSPTLWARPPSSVYPTTLERQDEEGGAGTWLHVAAIQDIEERFPGSLEGAASTADEEDFTRGVLHVVDGLIARSRKQTQPILFPELIDEATP